MIMIKTITHGPRQPLLDDRSLFGQIVRLRTLEQSWAKVWSNRGACGGDGITVEQFFRDAPTYLRLLSDQLQNGEYTPGKLRQVNIPKKNGGTRRLDIPSIRDRVAQGAVAKIMMPLLDQEFEPSSFGYRPGKSHIQAARKVSAAWRDGYRWVVDADIKNYFECVPHDRLMDRWAQSVSQGALSALVENWLVHWAPTGRGLAQGSPLSPLLANLYLDRMDEKFAGQGARIVRFADDFVILCRSRAGADGAMNKVTKLLHGQGLQLNEQKTKITSFEQGFSFLGHLFVRSMALKQMAPITDEQYAIKWLRRIGEQDLTRQKETDQAKAIYESKRQRGYSPGLRVLYITSAARRLNIRNTAFTVEEASGGPKTEKTWRELIAIPHQDVDRIEVWPDASVTEPAQHHCYGTDTPLAFVNGWGETLGWISAPITPMAGRHLAQAKLIMDSEKRIDLAKRIVDARLRNQRAVLRRLIRGREVPAVVTNSLKGLNRLIRDQAKAKNINMLRGYEGAAGRLWWPAISGLMRPEMQFSTRERKKADPTNICFNFLSSLLARDISIAVTRAGLHPGFGVLHDGQDRKDACIYDLMEEFRGHFIGGLAVYCVNKKIVQTHMFSREGSKWRMRTRATQGLIRAYETRVERLVKSPRTGRKVRWRRLMLEQALALAAHFDSDIPYAPYLMDY